MHEDTSHQDEPRDPAEEHIAEEKTAAAFAARRFPGTTAAPARKQRGLGQRVILPVVIFLGAIAALAWVSQYLPSWHSGEVPPTKRIAKEVIVFYQATPARESQETIPPLEFQRPDPRMGAVLALWIPRFLPYPMEKKDPPSYKLEFEKEDRGFYDYLFANESSDVAEVGLEYRSCTCAESRMCVLPVDQAKQHMRDVHKLADWSRMPAAAEEPECNWQDMPVNPTTGIVVAPGQGGLVRLVWKGDRPNTTLKLTVWAQPKDKPEARQEYNLLAHMAPSEPLHFFPPDIVELGELPESGAVTRYFLCWSGTRKHFEIDFPENKDHPCIQCKAVPLAPEECELLTNKLLQKDKRNSRALSGYRVMVTVAQKKDGDQLDMGLLYKQLPITANVKEAHDSIPAPHLHGLVPSDIRIGNQTGATLELGEFTASKGFTNKTFTLFTPKDVKLVAKSAHPKGLIPQIKEKGTVAQKTAWALTVSAGPNAISSGLMENSFILVEATHGQEPPRSIRIPVSGMARGSAF